jgi:hypothetical protein
MTAFEKIVTGMEAALELERELGVRVVECDRSLLADVSKSSLAAQSAPAAPAVASVSATPVPEASAPVAPARCEKSDLPVGESVYDFVFLHDRELSAAGAGMMEKIIGAMGKSLRSAPVVVALPLPPAKIYVVLGSLALKKFFPSMRGAPGQWLKSANGEDVLVSNSPEYILRFGAETPAVKKIKQDMWRSLKTVVQRLKSQ